MAHLIISKVSSSSETEGSASAQGYSNTDHVLTCLVAQVTMCLIFNHQIKIKAWKPFSSLRMCEHLMVIASTASPGSSTQQVLHQSSLRATAAATDDKDDDDRDTDDYDGDGPER